MEPKLLPGSFYGEARRSHEVAGLICVESVYAPDYRIPRHVHENAFFYIVLEGGLTETYGNRTRTGKPCTLVFHPAGESHANHWHNTGGRCFHIEIAPSWLERLQEQGAVLKRPLDFSGGLPSWLAVRLYREFQRMDTVSPLVMEGLALELLAEVSRSQIPSGDRLPSRPLRQARDLLHAQWAEPFSLDAVATAVGIHPAHLTRAFRQHYGCTMGEYVRQLRIEYACRELATSDRSLVEIALTAGFSDQSHFSKTFKRLMGLTPAEFQKHFRPRSS
jgi:AraC family transcriptional regulator